MKVIDKDEKLIVANSIKKLDLSKIKDFAVSELEIWRANNYLLVDSVGSLYDSLVPSTSYGGALDEIIL